MLFRVIVEEGIIAGEPVRTCCSGDVELLVRVPANAKAGQTFLFSVSVADLARAKKLGSNSTENNYVHLPVNESAILEEDIISQLNSIRQELQERQQQKQEQEQQQKQRQQLQSQSSNNNKAKKSGKSNNKSGSTKSSNTNNKTNTNLSNKSINNDNNNNANNKDNSTSSLIETCYTWFKVTIISLRIYMVDNPDVLYSDIIHAFILGILLGFSILFGFVVGILYGVDTDKLQHQSIRQN